MSLGSMATDRITGFTGVITGRVQYLTGCNQVLLAPRIKPGGEFVEPRWFDEQRVDVDGLTPAVTLNNGDNPGSDVAAPVR